MIGGAVAASCGSWSFPYLNACMNFVTFSLSSSVYDAGHSSASGSQHTVGTAFRFVPSGQKHFSKQDRASEGGGEREKEEESQSKQKVRHLTVNEQFSRRKGRTFFISESKCSASDFSLRTFYHELRKTSESNFTALLQ